MNTTSPALIERLSKLKPYLAGSILGQAHVISRVVSVLQRGELGLSTLGRPRGSFLLLGPTGVGKTELTIEFTRYLFGNDRLFRFDMSEFQTQDTIGLLLGARIGDVGLLARPLAGGNEGTLLFDEIEKAHPRVLDLLLQILDAARVTMASGETLDFSNFYVVLTSNLGAFEILNLQHSSFATMERHVLAKAQQSLRPELFARITEKLVFNRLSYDVQLEIARAILARELDRLRGRGFVIGIEEGVIPFLVQHGFHPRLGARPMRDAVEKFIRDACARQLLNGSILKAGRLSVRGNQLELAASL
jgi:ATP-dependent Clp protease ATP-binding subunit ClpB